MGKTYPISHHMVHYTEQNSACGHLWCVLLRIAMIIRLKLVLSQLNRQACANPDALLA